MPTDVLFWAVVGTAIPCGIVAIAGSIAMFLDNKEADNA